MPGEFRGYDGSEEPARHDEISPDDRKAMAAYRKYSAKSDKLPRRITLDRIHEPGEEPDLPTKIQKRVKSHLIDYKHNREKNSAMAAGENWSPPTTRQEVSEYVEINKYLRLDIERWDGAERTLEDGTVIAPGDQIAQIHINSNTVEQKTTPDYLRRGYKELKEAFKDLAAQSQRPELKNVKAFYGLSYLMSSGLADKMGFETAPVEDDETLLHATRTGYGIIAQVQSHNHDQPEKLADKIVQYKAQHEKQKEIYGAKRFTPAKYGFMSKEKLARLFGA